MIIEGYQRYIGVTDEEEAIVLRALEVHRNLLRHLASKKYGTHEHRAIKAKRLATIEALMDRVFPTGETQDQAIDRLEREAADLPFEEKRDRVLRNIIAQLQAAKLKGGAA